MIAGDATPMQRTWRGDSFRAALLLAGVGAATSFRVALGGADVPASYPAALVSAAILVTVAIAVGPRTRVSDAYVRDVAVGVLAAAALLGAWLSAGATLPLHAAQQLGPLAVWTPVVTAIAVAEEVLLRGALFTALQRRAGAPAALITTSLAFALMHVPLYGWQAVPVDLAAGALLGGLRLATGGVLAPAVAHAVTDLAAGWLG